MIGQLSMVSHPQPKMPTAFFKLTVQKLHECPISD